MDSEMTAKDIYQLLAQGEHVKLECKTAQSSLPNTIWETYSAFANTYGGTILLGVHENTKEKDTKKRFAVTGVEDAEKIKKDFWNIIHNTEKVSMNILREENIQTVDMEGKNVVAISVPQAYYTMKPIYINNNLSRGSFRRNHEGDYHCTEQELRMMVRDANEEGNDHMFLPHYTMDDIDPTTLKHYRQMFLTKNPDHVFNNLDDKEFLKQLGGYTVNRETREEGLTMAGLLMFGKGLPIRERFSNLRMDYIDKTNLIGEERYSDRITYDGTWENNLFNFIRIVLPRLMRDLPRPFRMEGVTRVDDTPQHKAVREAMTNAIIHADLMLNGLLRVEKYDDRFVLTNPGLLKIPVEQIYEGGETRARNQVMQVMLRMIGYGENLGSGFPLILSAWNEKHWLKPELIEQPELLQVKLILHIMNKEGDTLVTKDGTKDGTKEKNVTKDVTKELSDRQKFIITLIKNNVTINIPEMSRKLHVTERTIKRDLETLQKLGFLSREGGRKEGHWVINKQQND